MSDTRKTTITYDGYRYFWDQIQGHIFLGKEIKSFSEFSQHFKSD